MSEQENHQSQQSQQIQQTPPTPPSLLATQNQPVNKVTTKNLGRVAAGKKLAEWNRQKKINEQAKQKLLTHGDNDQTVPPAPPVPTQPTKHESNQIPYKVVGLIIVGVGGYLFYTKYMKQKPTKQVESQKIEPEKEQKTSKSQPSKCLKPPSDPFVMQ
eukprot:TRINITY_DN343_c0_g1_i4.p1 TRINITY_DN343_c0_g1~~TRINITY_DN343_c0_g1_i4.p1  ORF type:complete len:158 (-),score=23.52 TRINITY_DN343_c0_g1_i4:133-606(-)